MEDYRYLGRKLIAVAAENGHTWRWERSIEAQAGRRFGGFWRRRRG